jgi:hypothetical protein
MFCILSDTLGPTVACVLGIGGIGTAVVDETLRLIAESGIFSDDHDLLRRAAFVESGFGIFDGSADHSGSDYLPIGIWQMDLTQFAETKNTTFHPTLLEKYSQIKERLFGIVWQSVSFEELRKPLYGALAIRLYLITRGNHIPRTIFYQAKFWGREYYGADLDYLPSYFITPLVSGSYPEPIKKTHRCVHGIVSYDYDCRCFCFHGWMGDSCDIPNCNEMYGCSGSVQCSNRGVCSPGQGGKPVCQCSGVWIGQCCNISPPVWWYSDPHFQTVDGLFYDYFGVGIFAACYSIPNNFGLQLLLSKYKHASMIAGAALKARGGVVTITTTQGQQLPRLRINGTEDEFVVGTKKNLVDKTIVLYIEKGVSNNSVADFFFQFSNGAIYKVYVRYVETTGHQYIETAMALSVQFVETTTGLCGNMDGNPDNDFIGPDGKTFKDEQDFVKSWRLALPGADCASTDHSWSWNHSNFHPDDVTVMTNDYDLDHAFIYTKNVLENQSPRIVQLANNTCFQVGLTGKKLHNCIIDLVMTEESVVMHQQAFYAGSCPDDCSSHGDCVYGAYCRCSGLWRGETCAEGGCGDCPQSECVNGFCVCDIGFYEEGGHCLEASCDKVNNCTSLVHWQFRGPNDCLCNTGFAGADCGDLVYYSDDCHGHGYYVEPDGCLYDEGWSVLSYG